MKKDLIQLILKLMKKKGYKELSLIDTPFYKYNHIRKIYISEINNDLHFIIENLSTSDLITNTSFDMLYNQNKNDDFFMDLFITIHDKIKELEQTNN